VQTKTYGAAAAFNHNDITTSQCFLGVEKSEKEANSFSVAAITITTATHTRRCRVVVVVDDNV